MSKHCLVFWLIGCACPFRSSPVNFKIFWTKFWTIYRLQKPLSLQKCLMLVGPCWLAAASLYCCCLHLPPQKSVFVYLWHLLRLPLFRLYASLESYLCISLDFDITSVLVVPVAQLAFFSPTSCGSSSPKVRCVLLLNLNSVCSINT